VNADSGLLRLNRVDIIFGFAAFFVDSQNPKSSNGFERVGGCGVSHSHVNRSKIVDVDDRKDDKNCEQNALGYGADWRQRAILSVAGSTDNRK